MRKRQRNISRSDGAYLLMAALDEGRLTWLEVRLGLDIFSADPSLEEAKLMLLGTTSRDVRRRVICDEERRWRRGVVGGAGAAHATECITTPQRLQQSVAKKVHPMYGGVHSSKELTPMLSLDLAELAWPDLCDLTHWFAARLKR